MTGCLPAQYTHMEFTLNIGVARMVLCTFVQSDAHWFCTKWCPFVQSEVYSQSDAHWYQLEKHLLSGVSTENRYFWVASIECSPEKSKWNFIMYQINCWGDSRRCLYNGT